LVGSLLFGAILARYLSKPIHLMSEAFQSGQGRYGCQSGRQDGGRRDELADLGRDFDSLAQRLKQLIVGQRRLFHDVSHELRSPLARLNAAVDLARQQPDRLDEWLGRIERESGRMDMLVGEVLALARLDAEGAQHPPERLAIDVCWKS
jgi:signal transduction histidine kinase